MKVHNVKGDKSVDNVFEISISKTPEIIFGEYKMGDDLKDVKQYVINHCEEFIAHWNHELARTH